MIENNSNIITGADARKVILEGMKKVAIPVSFTLGPKGRNVSISKPNAIPILTKDGVTVARNIRVYGAESAGANMVLGAASKTNLEAGDGTTTSSILTLAIYEQGLESITEETNLVHVQRGIMHAAGQVIETLKAHAVPVEGQDGYKSVAMISSNGDEDVSGAIASALHAVGKHGPVMVSPIMGKTSVEITDGFMIDRGLALPAFVTDRLRMRAEHENAFVVLIDHKVSSFDAIMPFLEYARVNTRPIVFVCHEWGNEVKETLAANKERGLPVAVVTSPGDEYTRHDFLSDLAVVLGCEVVSSKKGMIIDNFHKKKIDVSRYVGSCELFQGGYKSTVFIPNKENMDKVRHHIADLNVRLENMVEGDDRELLEARIGRLAGKAATIKVGYSSDLERGERMDRVEDALNAVRAAIEEGVIEGGGHALYRASEGLIPDATDFGKGVSVMKTALKKPYLMLAGNAGIGASDVSPEWGSGLNIMTGEVVDLHEAGIIDPLKVVRLAVENAASTAGAALTTECVIDNK